MNHNNNSSNQIRNIIQTVTAITKNRGNNNFSSHSNEEDETSAFADPPMNEESKDQSPAQ
jgi:hypothetical protein